MPLACEIDETKICDECGDCDRCELNPKKRCNSCEKCLSLDADYKAIGIDKVIIE